MGLAGESASTPLLLLSLLPAWFPPGEADLHLLWGKIGSEDCPGSSQSELKQKKGKKTNKKQNIRLRQTNLRVDTYELWN